MERLLHVMVSERGKIKSVWVHGDIIDKKENLWERTYRMDDTRFVKKYRLSRDSMYFLVEKLRPKLEKKDTQMRKSLTVDFRIAVAIYILKSGCDASVAADSFKIGTSTANSLLNEVCRALNEVLWDEMVKFPRTKEERENNCKEFENRWQFPNTIGALDGTHVPILAPPEHAADYFNYKHYHSMVILAMVDAKYQFIYANVGRPGGVNDATIFNSSQLKTLTDDEEAMGDMFILGDGAFPLKKTLMKPYLITADMPEKQVNFNARLSRARVVVEDAFGRLKGRWRILLKRADYNVNNLREILMSCIILHNLCERQGDRYFKSWDNLSKNYERTFPQPSTIVKTCESLSAKQKRDTLCNKLFEDEIILEK